MNAEQDTPANVNRVAQDVPLRVAAGDMDEFSDLIRKGLNLQPILRSLKRNAWLIASVAALLSSAAALRTSSEPPVYQGGFQLLVEPLTTEARIVDPLALTRGQGGVPSRSFFELDYPSQIAVLQSPGVLQSIAEEIKPYYPDFSAGQLGGLRVGRVGPNLQESTKMLEVLYSGSDPELVELVLEKTAERFLKYSLEERRTRFSEGIKFIDDQLPELQKRVDFLQDELQNLQQRYDLISPNAQGEMLATQISTISSTELDILQKLQEQRALYTKLREQVGLNSSEAIAASTLSEEPGFRELQSQLQEVERQLAVTSVRYSEESPVMQSLRAKQRNLQALMEQESQRILGQSLGNQSTNPQVRAFQNSVRLGLIAQLVAAENQIQVLQASYNQLQQARTAIQQRFQQFPAIARRYADLQRQLEISTKTLNQLQDQRETLRIESAQTNVPWELITPPSIPRDWQGNAIPLPTDRKKLIAMIGVSLIAGMAAAILLDRLRNIFHCTEDVQDATELPVAGVIPFDSKASYPQGSLPWLNASDQGEQFSIFQEAFSSLYASLCFLADGTPVRSLTICSAAPDEGKTTVALHLAQTVALMGKRVLLVDANLRNPDLHTRFDLANSKGLSEMLSMEKPADDFIQKTDLPNLCVLSAGEPTLGAIRLLASRHMAAVMETLHQTFDLVIYDTPHLLGLKDATFLSSNTDGILMVVAIRKSRSSVTMQVLNELNAYRQHTIGVVVNHPRRRSRASYGYHQRLHKPSVRLQSSAERGLFHFRPKRS